MSLQLSVEILLLNNPVIGALRVCGRVSQRTIYIGKRRYFLPTLIKDTTLGSVNFVSAWQWDRNC